MNKFFNDLNFIFENLIRNVFTKNAIPQVLK